METLIKKLNNLSLRKYFVVSVLATLVIIVLLSLFTIWGCMSFRKYLLPDSNNVFLKVYRTYEDGSEVSYSVRVKVGEEGAELPVITADDKAAKKPVETKYAIQRIENSVDSLSPKRKMAYHFCGAAMVVIPIIFSIAGILLCGFFFYRRKLLLPLGMLSEATQQILDQNLDFNLRYDSEDEMGVLCSSFEQMRLKLSENYSEMWNMLEERRLLQASIAHDLRNPIAVIEGYTEYLQLNLKKGRLSEQRILKIAENINMSAKRLDNYTESVRTLNQMEDIELERQKISASDLLSDIEDDFKIIAQKKNIDFRISTLLSNEEICIDTSVLYRVLENVFNNAMRYAKQCINLDVSLNGQKLLFAIVDDGDGFSDETLSEQRKLLLAKASEDGHLGMGLAISRILCKKHGGSLEIGNNEMHNAVVKIIFSV